MLFTTQFGQLAFDLLIHLDNRRSNQRGIATDTSDSIQEKRSISAAGIALDGHECQPRCWTELQT
jgi:hypothetical protein